MRLSGESALLCIGHVVVRTRFNRLIARYVMAAKFTWWCGTIRFFSSGSELPFLCKLLVSFTATRARVMQRSPFPHADRKRCMTPAGAAAKDTSKLYEQFFFCPPTWWQCSPPISSISLGKAELSQIWDR